LTASLIQDARGKAKSSTSSAREKLSMQKAVVAPTTFRMFEDTIYAYEFVLATMELLGLSRMESIPPGVLDGVFDAQVEASVVPLLKERLAYFEQVDGEYTYQKFLTEVKGAVAGNHSNAYMTHWLYPYKGKFHPQMVRALLNIIGAKRGDTLLDPMAGSGTLNVEAKVMGIDSIGVDALPIGVMVSNVKCDILDRYVANKILSSEPPKVGQDMLVSHTEKMQESIDQISDPHVQAFYRLLYFEALSISRLPNRSFPVIWKKMLGFYLQTVEKSQATIDMLGLKLGKAKIQSGDARKLDIGDESVDHIVVSPPYAIAIDYVVRNTDQLQLMGFSTKEVYDQTIGLRGKGDDRITNYYVDLQKSIEEMHRVLKVGGRCVIVIGDTRYDKQTLPTIARATKMAEESGLKLLHNIPKVSAGRFGLFRTEKILVFERAE
jgi:hypothetical protein